MPLDRKKAYRITTIKTAESIYDNNFSLFYLGPLSATPEIGIVPFKEYRRYLTLLLSLNSKFFAVKGLDRLSFVVQRLMLKIFILVFRMKLRSYVLWTRDLDLGNFASKCGIKVACEIHQKFSKRETSLLKNMRHANTPWLMPISRNLQMHVESLVGAHYERLTYLPMGVDDMFFTQSKLHTEYDLSQTVRIGYLGSYQTLGISAGLEQLISNLHLLSDISVDLSIVGVGFEAVHILEKHLKDCELRNPNPRFHLRIKDWISHESIPSFLTSFHALILPYTENSINFYRFPIKSLEYASSGVPILCSDTSSHRSIFSASEVFFYDTTSPLSLRAAISQIFSDQSERKLRSSKALHLAKEHSYAKRAKTLIDVVLMT